MKTPKHLFFIHRLLFQLIKSQNSYRTPEKGYVLVVAISVVLGLTALVLLYGKISKTEKYNTTTTVDSNSGFYAAEAGLNLRANKIRQSYLDYQTPQGISPTSPTACFDNNSSNDGTGDMKCDKLTLAGGNQNRSSNSVTTYVVEKNNGQGSISIVPRGEPFQGLSMLEYGHSVYALGFKDTNSSAVDGKQASAILQMDISSRLIPMFQFTAFYTEDLEILPAPDMVLTGPIHTNGNLYLGSVRGLRMRGQVTTVKDIYNRRKNDNSTYPDGRVQIDNALGNALNLLFNGTGSTTQTINAMDPIRVKTAWGTQVQVRTDAPVSIPSPSILSVDGDYFQKADIRIKFKPPATSTANNMTYLNTIPFELTSIDRRIVDAPVNTILTDPQLRSLRQPVMVGGDLAAIPSSLGTSAILSKPIPNPFHLCTPVPLTGTLATWWNGLTANQKIKFREIAQQYLQEQIHSLNAPLLYTSLNIPIGTVRSTPLSVITNNTTPVLVTNLYNSFASTTSIATLSTNIDLQAAFPNPTERDTAMANLQLMTSQQIAGLPQFDTSNVPIVNTARCFIAAPITDIGRSTLSNPPANVSNHRSFSRFYNEREARDMRLLQMNIQSMAVWNRDGVFLNSGSLQSTRQLLYIIAPVDNLAPVNSFQRLGLAAVDISQGGIVIHATIDGNVYRSATDPTKVSPFGFAVVKGQQLFGLGRTINNQDPTGVTIATDQGLYVQGNYNLNNLDYHTDVTDDLSNPSTITVTRIANKQPSAFLADSFYPLSNTCLTNDIMINHLPAVNCDIDDTDPDTLNNNKVLPSHTEFNVAILAGTDITVGSAYNGGLENYPRFLENWASKEWRYRGSFVSISIPLYVKGPWGGGNIYSPPVRPWDYDTDFNDPKNLPPLTPQFVALKQNSFIRSFDQ